MSPFLLEEKRRVKHLSETPLLTPKRKREFRRFQKKAHKMRPYVEKVRAPEMRPHDYFAKKRATHGVTLHFLGLGAFAVFRTTNLAWLDNRAD